MDYWDLIPSFCSEILPEELCDGLLGSNSFILFRDFIEELGDGTLGYKSFILFRDFTRGTL